MGIIIVPDRTIIMKTPILSNVHERQFPEKYQFFVKDLLDLVENENVRMYDQQYMLYQVHINTKNYLFCLLLPAFKSRNQASPRHDEALRAAAAVHPDEFEVQRFRTVFREQFSVCEGLNSLSCMCSI